tara:strand:- start:219 stop:503 length:285 start_codon:yes stop_codon:yes gene_type:complete
MNHTLTGAPGVVRREDRTMGRDEALGRLHELASDLKRHMETLRTAVYSPEQEFSVDQQTIHELLIDELGLLMSRCRVNASGTAAWVDAELGGQR